MSSHHGFASDGPPEPEPRDRKRPRQNDPVPALSGDDIRQMLGATHKTGFAAREVIYRQGESASRVYFIRSGLVKHVSYLVSGRARIVRLHGAGSMLGVSGLVAPVCEHTAVAIDDVEVECIPIRRLAKLRAENPRLYALIAESWYIELRDADTWITQFSTGSIRARVARLVNYLSSLTGCTEQTGSVVALLTCSEMAAVLGVTPESVSRVLAEFKRSDLLHETGQGAHECYRRDVPALEAIAED